MDITEVSILHHAGIVFVVLWLLSLLNRCHPIAYFLCFIYMYLVHERYVMRLRRKLQFEERKQANQRRVLTDSESVRWLNHVVEKMWPMCMEQIASQKILLPIIPWFLEKYKPWTAKKAVVQHLYLGRNPPVFTEMRVLRQSTGDDHLVLELGMNFLTAEDMSTILAVKLRRRLGFGMWAKLHLTGMHVEGKVLVGVKFLRDWPFLGRLRICFAEPPYFQMTVKPLFTHGLDVTELPGIAGWLDKLLSMAFEQTLVEPNMLVVDLEKFVSPQADDSWFSVDEKETVGYAKVEVIEASDMKPSDLNGLADPYVKVQLGPSKFRTKVQKKTLAPKWHEEFKIPICTWESTNVLAIEVCDKDHFVDDTLGDCSVNISDLRDGQRHDMWLSLQNIKMGRLHIAVTVLEDSAKTILENIAKGVAQPYDKETSNKEDIQNSFSSDAAHNASFSSISSDKAPSHPDNFEPINIEGQNETGIWVHRPGSEVAQTWEPRKGKSRRSDTHVHRLSDDSLGGSSPHASGSINDDSSGGEQNGEGKNRIRSFQRGFRKIRTVFHKSPGKDDSSGSLGEPVDPPHANLKAVNEKAIGINFVVEETTLLGPASGKTSKGGGTSVDGSGPESPSQGHVKDMAKSILKHAGRGIRHVLSRKGSTKLRDGTAIVGVEDIDADSDSSDDESLSSPNGSCDHQEQIVQGDGEEPASKPYGKTGSILVENLKSQDPGKLSDAGRRGNEVESSSPKLPEGNTQVVGEKDTIEEVNLGLA